MIRLILIIDLQSVHETGLQSRFSCLAQNVFQSNCKLTTLSVIYLYHKQDCFFFFHFFGYVPNVFPLTERQENNPFWETFVSGAVLTCYTGWKLNISELFFSQSNKKRLLRRPGIEPGSTAWKAAMLTTIPPTPWCENVIEKCYWVLSEIWKEQIFAW